MKGSLAQEIEILTQIQTFRADPWGFVNYAYPWNQPGTPLAGVKGPRDWQREELIAIGDHVRAQEFAKDNGLPLKVWKSAYSAGRGPGKSAMLMMLAHWHLSTHLGSTATIAANTEHQMRTKTFSEAGKWFGMAINSHWWNVESLRVSPQPWLAELVGKPVEEGGLNIDSKYWHAAGQTWNEDAPDSFAGTHNTLGLMVLFDEGAGIHSGVWDVTEGFFTEEGPYRFWLSASQMRNRSGRFYDIGNDPAVGHGWRFRTLSTRGMPGVDQAVVEDQIRRYGENSDFVRVEILGLAPRTSSDQFIPWDAMNAAQRNDLFRDYGEPLILGVDPAPRGKTSWRFRQGRNARDCCGGATFGSWFNADNVELAEKVLALDQKYRPDAICIDFGLGTGLIDILKRKRTHGRVHEVKFGDAPHEGKESEWGSHAAELWAAVRDWLPGAMVEKDSGEKGTLSHQLTDRGWRYSQREEGKKILETKEDLRSRGVASPDDADALACTMEVNPPRNDQRKGQGAVVIADGAGGSSFFD